MKQAVLTAAQRDRLNDTVSPLTGRGDLFVALWTGAVLAVVVPLEWLAAKKWWWPVFGARLENPFWAAGVAIVLLLLGLFAVAAVCAEAQHRCTVRNGRRRLRSNDGRIEVSLDPAVRRCVRLDVHSHTEERREEVGTTSDGDAVYRTRREPVYTYVDTAETDAEGRIAWHELPRAKYKVSVRGETNPGIEWGDAVVDVRNGWTARTTLRSETTGDYVDHGAVELPV